MDPTQNKLFAYAQHVADCRACTRCGTDALNPKSGGFAMHPSPWAMLRGDLDAEVVVVGQDFACQEQPYDAPNPELPTNKNLARLIAAAGARRVYLTNAVLCLKPGVMSAAVPSAWVKHCASHLRRTIEIIQPLAVAALGAVAWRATCRAFDVASAPAISEIVGATPILTPGAPALFGFNHCGGLGLVRRPLIHQLEDWRRLGQWLASRRTSAA
jgi:uracil-DNA glycosylase family 4